MKRTSIMVLIATFCLSACRNSAESEADKALQALLVDPESARYSFVVRNYDTICGFVNAKNRFGGYTGDHPFFIQEGEAPLILPMGKRAMEENTEHCIGTEFSQQMISRTITDVQAGTREVNEMLDTLAK